MSDLKDGVLGLLAGATGYLRALFQFVAILAVLGVLWHIWLRTTTFSITNETEIELRDVVLIGRDGNGAEETLWQLNIEPKRSKLRVAMDCCWRLVVRQGKKETSCRYPSEAPAKFIVVNEKNGGLWCGGDHRSLLP